MQIRTGIAIAVAALAAIGAHANPPADSDGQIARGRYLATIGGCNDCHTPGYLEGAGKIAESNWLVGSSVGFQGPWGTSYPSNLRLLMQSLSEDEWLRRARSPMRPPMPWFNLSAMSDADLRAVYRFVRSLGPAGTPVPQYVAPGGRVNTPYFVFVPQNLPKQTAKAN